MADVVMVYERNEEGGEWWWLFFCIIVLFLLYYLYIKGNWVKYFVKSVDNYQVVRDDA